MSTYNEQLQNFWKMYSQEAGKDAAVNAHDVAAWAYHKKLWQPRATDVIGQLADDLARAWREEYRTDERGRRYRAKHAVRTSQGGKQMTLWADMNTAARSHMEKAFSQRRHQIVGDCVQLKTDVDVYNDQHKVDEPLQVVLDFTKDVEEAQIMQGIESEQAA